MIPLPIEEIIHKYESLTAKMLATTNTNELIELSKLQKQLEPQFTLAKSIKQLTESIANNQQLLAELTDDDELKSLVMEELAQQQEQLKLAHNNLLAYLSPKDSRDEYGIILEIRAGAGGDESSIFASEILRMYTYLAQRLNFQLKIISTSPNPEGGFKEVIAEIYGSEVYSWFKYEGGVHRVQRVPVTEKQGRIHTSTISVAILPLIDKNNDFKLDPKDVEIIVSTSQGAGGQSVNTTYSAVRVRHIPTGIEARSQDERSQQQNKEKALQVLTSRVFNFYEEQRLAQENSQRLQQVGRADRSEKIRTYNFPQDRLTDHRYNLSWNNLAAIMDGDIYEVIKEIKRIEAEKYLLSLAKSEQT